MGACLSNRSPRVTGLSPRSATSAEPSLVSTVSEESFWDDQAAGSPERWKAIRASFEVDDKDLAEAILASAGMLYHLSQRRILFCE